MVTVTGADIRRYRKLVGLNQIEFSKRLGIAQPTLSQMEGGWTAVTAEYIEMLIERFDEPTFQPPFREYLAKIEADATDLQVALEKPESRVSLLTVWEWEEGCDIARRPEPSKAVDVVAARPGAQPAIAFRLPKKTDHWEAGEIFVFERTTRDEVEDGEICLLQVRLGRTRGTAAWIAVATVTSVRRGRTLQFKPVEPAGPVFEADDSVLAVLRAVYRGRHLK